jgi:hypothetical protein
MLTQLLILLVCDCVGTARAEQEHWPTEHNHDSSEPAGRAGSHLHHNS